MKSMRQKKAASISGTKNDEYAAFGVESSASGEVCILLVSV